MSVFRLYFYGETAISGPDVDRFIAGNRMSHLVSPNNRNIIRIESNQFANCTQLELNNAANIAFAIVVNVNVGNETYTLTRIRYNGNYIVIDKRWMINEKKVTRRIPKVPDIMPNDLLTVEFNYDDVNSLQKARFDVQMNNGNCAAVFFDHQRVLFARFNGNYVVNRYGLLIIRGIHRYIRLQAEIHLREANAQLADVPPAIDANAQLADVPPAIDANAQLADVSPAIDANAQLADVPPAIDANAQLGDVPPAIDANAQLADVPPAIDANAQLADVPPAIDGNAQLADVPPAIDANAQLADVPPAIDGNAQLADVPPAIDGNAQLADVPPAIDANAQLADVPPAIDANAQLADVPPAIDGNTQLAEPTARVDIDV